MRSIPKLAVTGILAIVPTVAAGRGEEPPDDEAWIQALLRLREAPPAGADALAPPGPVWTGLERRFPVPCDWALADAGADFLREFLGSDAGPLLRRLAARAIAEVGPDGARLRAEIDSLPRDGPEEVRAALGLYVRAAGERRARRLAVLLERSPRIVFTKHWNLGGSHYAYTEGLSDAQDERRFHPGASLCLLEMEGPRGRVRPLLDTREGCLRDPDVDFDGRRILFSWKKSDREDDWHLHEMDAATGEVRPITAGPGFADYEGAYLPDGGIVFNSTRPVQTVDCWWTEVSNLYACARDGTALRRLAFDQVHDNFPTILPDGRVVYTRWEYNDRGQMFVQGLFTMNPDGTGQTALYGNNSWFPTSILHARAIPGTRKLAAILSGHHVIQVGKLAVIDPGRGTEEGAGVQLVAPEREAPVERKVDAYGQDGELFQYPYPLTEDAFLVAMSPLGWARKKPLFGIYLVLRDGRREILAADPEVSCNQPIPLAPRPRPPVLPDGVDYTRSTATFFVRDVYAGPGLAGVPRGSIEKLRVVALEYRAAGVCTNFSLGPAGDSQASTPVSIGNGSWDVKTVLGEATVREDGSAWFAVPARTPVYFQALDGKGYCVQTMRSWSALQPGEAAVCGGCHEPKGSAPAARPPALALRSGPETLRPFPDPPRGFSFVRDVQPILDRHCISCHKRRGERPGAGPAAGAERPAGGEERPEAFSLLPATTPEEISGRAWSDAYLALTAPKPLALYGYPPALTGDPDGPLVRWVAAQSAPPMLAPRSTGAARSRLLEVLEKGHRGVRLDREELKAIACWIDLAVPYCGDYEEANVWPEGGRAKYRRFVEKRRRMEEIERRNIEELIAARRAPD